MATKTLKVTPSEISKLAGYLDFLRRWVEIDRTVYGKESRNRISQNVEDTINDAGKIIDNLFTFGSEW